MNAIKTDTELQKLGRALQWGREATGMTRAELAETIGCKYEDIRLYENGERAMRIDRLFCILDVLGLHLSEEFVLTSKTGVQIEPNVYSVAVKLNAVSPEDRRVLLKRINSMLMTAEKKSRQHLPPK